MASFLDALIGSSGILPLFGDDDGAAFFTPYGRGANLAWRRSLPVARFSIARNGFGSRATWTN